MNIRLPNITGKTPQEQLTQIHSYLYQLAQDLQFSLGNIEEGVAQVAPSVTQKASTALPKTQEQKAQESFNEIKSLIIKSGEVISAYYEEIDNLLRLSGEYVVASDFGTYKEETEAVINVSNEKIQSLVAKTETIDADMDAIRQSHSEIKQTADDITLRVSQVEAGLEGMDSTCLHIRYSPVAHPEESQMTVSPNENTRYMGTCNTTTKEAPKDPNAYAWTLIKGADGVSGEDAAVLRIDSSRGTVFKNDEVSTVLHVVIQKGGKQITDITGLKEAFGASAYLQWKWLRAEEDQYGVISASDTRFSNDGFAFTLSPEDVDTKITFRCELIT